MPSHLARLLLGCSGAGAAEAIARAELVGFIALALTMLAVAVRLAWKRGRTRMAIVAAPLFIGFHPAWWISARHGDCGSMHIALSVVAVIFVSVWLAWPRLSIRGTTG